MTLIPLFNKKGEKGGRSFFAIVEKQVLNKKDQDREGIKPSLHC